LHIAVLTLELVSDGVQITTAPTSSSYTGVYYGLTLDLNITVLVSLV
jgi:hypothetical protein